MNPLIAEFLWLVSRRESQRDLKPEKNLTCQVARSLALKIEGPQKEECRWPLGAESDPWLTTSKKMWTSDIYPPGTEFCQKPEETQKKFVQEPPDKSPAQLTPWRENPVKSIRISHLQNRMKMKIQQATLKIQHINRLHEKNDMIDPKICALNNHNSSCRLQLGLEEEGGRRKRRSISFNKCVCTSYYVLGLWGIKRWMSTGLALNENTVEQRGYVHCSNSSNRRQTWVRTMT